VNGSARPWRSAWRPPGAPGVLDERCYGCGR
jgi:hypothetical protein